MNIFSKLLGGGLDQITSVAEKFIPTREKQNAFKLELRNSLTQIEADIEETYRTELQARSSIIQAEMTQGDKYTKRARPSIIYVGLIFIALVYVIMPIYAYIAALRGIAVDSLPELSLPAEFWWAWGTVISVYGAARSVEKRGITNKLTNFITGSGAVSMNTEDLTKELVELGKLYNEGTIDTKEYDKAKSILLKKYRK